MAKTQTSRKTKVKTRTKTKLKIASKKAKMPKRKAKKTAAKRPSAKKKAKPISKATTRKIKVAGPRLQVVKSVASSEISRIGVGDLAPHFTLADQNGQNVSLSDFQGRKVVLYFYPKDDTPGCTKEACSFRDNIGAIDAEDAVILGVSFDGGDSHQKFIAKYNLNFKLLSDSEKKVARDYGCYVQKNMYGNISWGIERSTFVIDRQGKISAAFRRVQVDGHTQEVLEALKAIA